MAFHVFFNYILISVGFIFNFFLTGYVFTELTLARSKIEPLYKFPLYFVFSYLISTWSIFLLAYLFGLNNLTIIFFYVLVTIGLFFVGIKPLIVHKESLLISLAVFAVFVIALYTAIFYKYDGYFVMASDNWQDTALHFSITQSLQENNFPPKAPYFSGKKLNYYYFADLHSAIIGKLTNEFHPRIFVADNSLFAAVYALSVYCMAYYFTKNKKISLISAFIAVFNGNLLFINFIHDFFTKNIAFTEILRNGSYVLEYGGLAQMTPLTNYFLQNRPMMAGLPVLAVGIYLIEDKKYFPSVLSILLSSMFQPLISLVLILYFVIKILFSKSKRAAVASLFILAGMSLLVYLNKQDLNLILTNLKFVPWEQGKPFIWYIKFVFVNFGIFTPLFLISLLYIKKIKNLHALLLWTVLVFMIPFLCVFTIDKYDMLKFFYLFYIEQTY